MGKILTFADVVALFDRLFKALYNEIVEFPINFFESLDTVRKKP
jgi:hypothetical protein